MIVAKTRLRKIPTECTSCPFSKKAGIKRKADPVYLAVETYICYRCSLTYAEVPFIYNKNNNIWEYRKCKTCPLKLTK